MAIPELSNFIPNIFAADIVGIFDSNFNQVFVSARPIKARIKEVAKVMQHPIETGEKTTDHIVFEPIEIDMPLAIAYPDELDIYNLIRTSYKNATLFTIQTRTTTYNSMLISEMPHDEDADKFDLVTLMLKFKEADFITAQYAKLPPAKVQNKTQSSTVDKGEVKPQPTQQSIIGSLTGLSK